MMPSNKRPGEIPKSRYYVWYLGWKESHGLAGREFTEPIVKDLVIRRKREQPIKLTLELSTKELKIYQVTKGKFGRTEKVKFPTVPTKDVTYAAQGLAPDDDVVACIYLGYNPTTRRAVHVHVYRFDSPMTARTFCDHLTDVIRQPEHEQRIRVIEDDLTSRGEITPRPRDFIRSYDMTSTVTSAPSTVSNSAPSAGECSASDVDDVPDRRDDPVYKERDERMESLAAELNRRLGNPSEAPLLLPPQDYDTVRRVRGNLTDRSEYEARKCKNRNIVGPVAADGCDPDDNRADDDDGDTGDSIRNGRGSGFGTSGSDGVADDRRRDWRRDDADVRNPHDAVDPRMVYGPNPADPEWPGFRRQWSNVEPMSRSPEPYTDGYLAQAQSARSPAARNQVKDARTGFESYPDEAQYVMAFPAGKLRPPGVVSPSGVMAVPSSLPHGAERITRQVSSESSPLSDPYGAASPKQHLPRAEDRKKKEKKEKKKGNKSKIEEPPPDYTVHPSNARRVGALYA